MFIIFFQLLFNISSMSTKCNTTWGEIDLGYVFLLTLGSWIAIIGILIATLIYFPKMKSPFADVIGYFIVANSANKLLADMLVNTDVDDKMNNISDDTKKQSMQGAAEAVVKMLGDVSILINQIVPSNFVSYWDNLLTPLIKPTLSSEDILAKKQELFNLVILRDNVGEACWYIYTAILLISIIGYKISNKPCELDPKVANAKYAAYLDKQQKDNKANANANSVTYTLD